MEITNCGCVLDLGTVVLPCRFLDLKDRALIRGKSSQVKAVEDNDVFVALALRDYAECLNCDATQRRAGVARRAFLEALAFGTIFVIVSRDEGGGVLLSLPSPNQRQLYSQGSDCIQRPVS